MEHTNKNNVISLLQKLCSLALLSANLVLGSIPAEGAPFAYVTNRDSSTVSVIETDPSSVNFNTVVATIPVGPGRPNGVAATPDGTRVYVANQDSGTVSVIDTATNRVVGTVLLGNDPFGIAITPDGARAYVTRNQAAAVSVIATATNTVVATIPVGSGPIGIAITPDGARAYVANSSPNTVSVIATATNTVVATIPVGSYPFELAIRPDGARVYVANLFSQNLSVIDTATNTVVATVFVGINTAAAAITPDGAHAYVTTANGVSVVDTATNTVVASVAGGGREVAITPDGARAYVASVGNIVRVIDTATNTVVANVPVGSVAVGVTITRVLPNQLPVADAGPDQTKNEESTVQLDGTGSSGENLTFFWEQLTGPSVTLSNPTSATPTFTAPIVSGGLSSQTLTFRLTVTDSSSQSSFDTVDVVVVKCAQSPPNLVGWWPGDGNARDIISGSNGALSGGASFATGKIGQAFSFDGQDDYLDYGTSPAFNWAARSSFSYAFWLQTTESHGAIVAQRTNTGAGEAVVLVAMGVSVAPGEIYALIRDDSGSVSGCFSGCLAMRSNKIVNDGQWHHIVVVRDGSAGQLTDELRIYVDGVPAQSTFLGGNGVPGPITTNMRALGSERRWVQDGFGNLDWRYLNGRVDEFQIFNRALSGQEIQAIYAGICSLAEPPTVTLAGSAITSEGQVLPYTFSVGGSATAGFSVTPSFPDCGAGGNLVPGSVIITPTAGGTFQCSFPDGPASPTVRMQVTSSSGADSNVATVAVTVANAPPTVNVLDGPLMANEGDTKSYLFMISDPGQDTWAVKAGFPDCGTGGSLVLGSLTTTPSGGSFLCSFPDGPATPTVRVQVTDSDEAESNLATRTVSIANAAPTVTLTGPTAATEGQSYTFAVTDAGQDTFTLAAGFPSCGPGGTLVAGSLTITATGGSFACAFPGGPASSPISVQVADSDGAASNVALTVFGRRSGEVKAWGYNAYGQLGDGTTMNRTTPVAVSGLSGVVAVSGTAYSGQHSLALLDDGTVQAWGWNANGELGDGTTTNRTTPVAVSGLSGVVAIAAGGAHNLALLSDGTVKAWGWNGYGQLGDGTTISRTTPVAVSGLSGVVAIAAGRHHSLALLSDGTIRAWGSNSFDQFGNPVTFSSTPVMVSGLSGVVAIAAGSSHNLALLGDGTVKAWGWNSNGQLGDGTRTDRTTPVAVSGLSGVTAIVGGLLHSLALLTDGTARAWGGNGWGQLGNGFFTDSLTPVVVSGLSGGAGIAAGAYFSLARLNDGAVRAWGQNVNGQLGDGTTTNRTTPVAVSGLSGVVAIAAGYAHSLGIVTTTPPPTANAGPDQTVNEGAIVNLDGSASSDPGGTGLTYQWRQTAGPPVTLSGASTARATFVAPNGTTAGIMLAFELSVSDGQATSSDSVNITVHNVGPTATLTGPTAAIEGQSYAYTFAVADPGQDTFALAAGSPSCGPGGSLVAGSLSTTASGGSFACSFPDGPASSTVSVEVADSDGATSNTATLTVTVANAAPTATFAVPATVPEATPISLSLTNSLDVAADLSSLQYAFDCGTGSGYGVLGAASTATCPTTDNGVSTLKGKVRDKDGGETEYTATVTITNVAPTATFTATSPITEGGTSTLALSAAADPGTADTTAGFRYAFACDGLDASLGSSYAAAGTSSTASCPFADNGTFTVKGRIFDKDNGATTYQATLLVNNAPPTATFTASSPVAEGTPIALAFTNPVDGAADLPALQYAFDCGSGYGAFGAATTAACPTTDNGTRTVKGKVRDKDGGETEYTTLVTVTNVAPTATFIATSPLAEGGTSTLALSAAADPSPGDTTAGFRYAFACDGLDASLASTYAAAGTSSTASCPFADNGSFTVKGRIFDKDNGTTIYQVTVLVNNAPPTATFMASSPVPEGSPISLALTNPVDGAADLPTLQYAFDCGAGAGYGPLGATNTATCPTTDNGTRTVKGKVGDKDGGETEYTATVTIQNVAPTVAITGAPATSPEGTALSLGSSATDPGADTHTYAWTVTKNGAPFATGTTPSLGFTPDDNGTYVVTLTVTDKDGGAGADSKTIAVTNVPPAATFTAPATVNEGNSITLSFTSSADPSAADSAAGFTYAFDCGTGAGYGPFGSITTATCPTADNGTYTVKGKVRDKDGGETEYTAPATSTNVAPTASFTAPATVPEGTAISLALTSPVDVAADLPTLQYAFDCGTGSGYGALGAATTATCPTTDNGTRLAKAKVRDKDGGETEYTATVTVQNVAPTVVLVGPTSANEGENKTYTFSVTDPGQDTFALKAGFPDCGTGGSLVAGSVTTTPTGGSLTCSFPDGPTSPLVRVQVMDSDGADSNLATLTVTVANAAPTVTLTGPAAATEGQSYSYTFSVTDVGQDTFTVAAGSPTCGPAGSLVAGSLTSTGTGGSFACAFPDGPASSTVSVQVADSDGTASTTATLTVTVANAAPTVTLTGPTAATEGQSYSYTFAVTDAGQDTFTVAAGFPACGTGDTLVAGSLTTTATGGSFTCAFPDGPASSTVSVQVADSDGTASTTASLTVTVANVAPTITNLNTSVGSIFENGSVTLTGAFADPGSSDGHTATIQWGDGTSTVVGPIPAGTFTFSATHQYLDDNPGGTPSDGYNILVTVVDKDLGSVSGSAGVTVVNAAPAMTGVSGPGGPIQLGTSAAVTTNFTDAGIQDTHTCTFDWDDGTTSSGTVSEAGGSGSCSATRTYTAAGVYDVAVTVTDDDTGAATSNFEFVVVYDPSAGYVTGGGWITSPAGAYTANPALTGRANFGFVSKYQKGGNVPTGQTQFQFRVANFNFHSSVYEWLVVAGAKAQYKGSGTVNGAGDYGFLLTAIDGQRPGGGGADKFRIKIWDKGSGGVVYDNKLGASDDMDSADPQEIGGGSIVIHAD